MKRLKLYYPENQIIRNLYTSGKQFMLETGIEYVGFYHKYSTGEVYTESGWNEFQSKKLIPYRDSYTIENNSVYRNLTKTPVDKFVAPVYYFPILKESDYVNGFVTRYFVRRNNVSTDAFAIIEINESQYSKITTIGNGVNGNLYTGIEIPWKLTGPRKDVITDGIKTESGVEDTNERIVTVNNVKMPGLLLYVNDFIELSIYSPVTPKSIKDKFLVM